jgi:SHS2 domain-containing protein
MKEGEIEGKGEEVKRKFRYLDHMTDLIVEAYGNTLEELFENSAIGLVNAMFEISKVDLTTSIKIIAEGHDFKSLLYDWIEKIILAIYIDRIIIIKFDSLSFSRIYTSITNNNKKVETVITEESKLIAKDLNFADNKENSSKYDAIYKLEGIGKGEIINLEKHEYKVEVKSVTYHEMQIKKNKDGYYTARFLVDL